MAVNNVPNSYLIPERYGLMDSDLIFKRAFNFLNFQLCFSQVHLLCRACYFYIIKFFVLPFKLFPTKILKYTVFSPFLCFLITVDRTALFHGILLSTFNECFENYLSWFISAPYLSFLFENGGWVERGYFAIA